MSILTQKVFCDHLVNTVDYLVNIVDFLVNFKPPSIGNFRFQIQISIRFGLIQIWFNPFRSDSMHSVRFNLFQSVSVSMAMANCLCSCQSNQKVIVDYLVNTVDYLVNTVDFLVTLVYAAMGGLKKHKWPLKVLKIFILISLMFVNYI